MAALEVSYDRDWLAPATSRSSTPSGDRNPRDRTRTGFDSIFDRPNFAGGGFSFFNRLGIRLAGSGVALVERGSLLTSPAQQQGRRTAELRQSRRATRQRRTRRRSHAAAQSDLHRELHPPRRDASPWKRCSSRATSTTTSAPTSASAFATGRCSPEHRHRRRHGRAFCRAAASKTSTKTTDRCTTSFTNVILTF